MTQPVAAPIPFGGVDNADRKQINEERARYIAMKEGDFGAFFDPLDASWSDIHPAIFPRLESLLKQKKQHWHNALPLMTNIFRSITNLVTTFTLGEGIEITFDDPDHPVAKRFEAFWRENEMDLMLSDALENMTATGLTGFRFRYNNGKIEAQEVPFHGLYPHQNGTKGITLCWKTATDDATKCQTHYVIQYTKGDDACYHADHAECSHDPVHNTWATPEAIDLGVAGVNGRELCQYPNVPVVLLRSPERGAHGLGQSLFTDIVMHVQALSFLDTVAMVELQSHFLSKMAVPRSMVGMDATGRPQIEPGEFMVFEDEGKLPKYIQKDNAFFEDLRAFRTLILHQIGLMTGIPPELIDASINGKDERVGVAKLRRRPFEKRIEGYQRQIKRAVRDLFDCFVMFDGGINHQYNTLPKITVSLPCVMHDTK